MPDGKDCEASEGWPTHGPARETRGRFLPVLRVALPMIFANLTIPLMALTATFIAGHFDDPADLAGVTLGSSFVTMIYMLFTFLRMSATAVVAQADGAEDMELVRDTFLRVVLLAAIFGLSLALLSRYWVPHVLPLFGGDAVVEAKARRYIDIRLLAAPAALSCIIAGGYLLGRRRAMSALALQAATNLVNVVCSFALVHGMLLGVDGIGWAAVAAEYAGILLAFAIIFRAGFPGAPPINLRRLADPLEFTRLGHLGRDLLIRSLGLLVSQFLMVRFSAIQGATILAANAILLHLHTVVGYAIDGFSYATQALVGRAIGARNLSQLKQTTRAAFELAGAMAAVFALLYSVAGREIVSLLTNHTEIAVTALRYMPWLVVLTFFTLWSYILDGIFIGSTRVRDARNMTVVAVGFFGLLIYPMHQIAGNDGLWMCFVFLMAMRGLLLGRIWMRLDWSRRILPGG